MSILKIRRPQRVSSYPLRALCLLAVSLTAMLAIGQNLVPNPSFEKHSYCPVNFNQGQLEIVSDWYQASNGTSDYFNGCSRLVGVPKNGFGHQEAKEGRAYLGLITYAPSKRNYREYMQAKLITPLSAGDLYCVSFYVSSADQSHYVSDGLGAIFSEFKIKNPGQKNIAMKPDLANPAQNVLADSKEWMLLSDIYEARGGERYITLGNFLPDRDIVIKKRNLKAEENKRIWESTYYFVDEVSVVPVAERSECPCSIPLIAADIADAERWQIPEGDEVSFDNVYFAFDTDELDPASRLTLDDVSSWMRNNDYLHLQVQGHTDSLGRSGYNVGLSERRAEQVMAYLAERGVPRARLEVAFFGSRVPVADNTTSGGRAQNRRVDFRILEKEFKDFEIAK